MSALREILSQRHLKALFQPILDLRSGDVLGFEGLIRGPEESKLHMPDALFKFARKAELSVELERLCRETILHRFATPDPVTKRLFINSSILSMEDALDVSPLKILRRPNQVGKVRAFRVIRSARHGSLNAFDTLSKTYS